MLFVEQIGKSDSIPSSMYTHGVIDDDGGRGVNYPKYPRKIKKALLPISKNSRKNKKALFNQKNSAHDLLCGRMIISLLLFWVGGVLPYTTPLASFSAFRIWNAKTKGGALKRCILCRCRYGMKWNVPRRRVSASQTSPALVWGIGVERFVTSFEKGCRVSRRGHRW